MKSASQIAIERLDEVARRLEVTWGVGRLPRLVPEELAQRFYRQFDKLNSEIVEEATAGIANVEREAQRMMNAWMALEAAAKAAGADPISPKRIEGQLPDGRLLVIVDGPESAWKVAADDRAAVVWSIEEISRVLWRFELVNDAKTVWPGARVENARVDPERTKPKVDWKRGDELPVEMLMGAG